MHLTPHFWDVDRNWRALIQGILELKKIALVENAKNQNLFFLLSAVSASQSERRYLLYHYQALMWTPFKVFVRRSLPVYNHNVFSLVMFSATFSITERQIHPNTASIMTLHSFASWCER